jgi:hypothetical protein
MRKNKQDQYQFTKAKQVQDKVHSRKEPVRLIVPIIGVLAFLLLTIMGSVSLVQVKKIYATSECGILFLCPTPTPRPTPVPSRPTPSPTPVAHPTPSPTPTPSLLPTPHTTQIPVPSPTATMSISPTATVTKTLIKSAQTPIPSPTDISVTKGGNVSRPAPSQVNSSQVTGSKLSSLMVIAVVIFLCLLLSLGIGLFILRRVLLPPLEVKLPPSGATPWSRTTVSHPAVWKTYE